MVGMHRLALAEDVVQDTFCRALEVWRVRGVPDNPSAWLNTAARNRALDVLRRQRLEETHSGAVGMEQNDEREGLIVGDDAFAEHLAREDQLRMMLTCCHPRVPEDARVALVLNILCGFGAGEIAAAFLNSRAAVEKRIARGKETLRSSKRLFALDDADFAPRLSAVRRSLYLLFNEGYHGAAAEAAVRSELCHEAIRLGELLVTHPAASSAETRALLSLMYLHAARLPARVNADGDLNPFMEQDRSIWDRSLVGRGLALLEGSAVGDTVSSYHVEAAIAAVHAGAPSAEETDWEVIVSLYDRLMALAPSPVVGLNRAIAVAQRDGPDRGILALQAVSDRERLTGYPFYPAALAELESQRGNRTAAREYFSAALALARNPAERRFLERRIGSLESA